MNIQILGIKKCFETKKAERYFKERRIKYQLVYLNEKPLSKRELESVRANVELKELIDIKSKDYEKSNIKHMREDSVKQEILLNNPKLYKTPIVRNGRQATVGYKPDVWKEWE
ncbi:arsenate reductase family protein [Clostridium rectalis]|uniref:arsenate reductase family protein n=1 Tax=Clostridium rectalis TaxID=2040295 RepID=UPI000F6391F9|nr:ArsC/Spx/MgsR family protein [Clostridium rectalis]